PLPSPRHWTVWMSFPASPIPCLGSSSRAGVSNGERPAVSARATAGMPWRAHQPVVAAVRLGRRAYATLGRQREALTYEERMSMPVPPPARVERDSMGELPVPEGAYYGASTMRAVKNFPIS